MDTKEQMTQWLIDNRSVLNITGLEVAIGCPNSTLIKAVNGSKAMPEKWAKKLLVFINEKLIYSAC